MCTFFLHRLSHPSVGASELISPVNAVSVTAFESYLDNTDGNDHVFDGLKGSSPIATVILSDTESVELLPTTKRVSTTTTGNSNTTAKKLVFTKKGEHCKDGKSSVTFQLKSSLDSK